MAKDKPKNGRRTKDVKAIKATRQTPTVKGKPDKEGLRKTFKTETKYGGKTVKTGVNLNSIVYVASPVSKTEATTGNRKL